ncbi:MAG: hypothetical protein DI539_30350, partial [Flavobacterium psychrophilum]
QQARYKNNVISYKAVVSTYDNRNYLQVETDSQAILGAVPGVKGDFINICKLNKDFLRSASSGRICYLIDLRKFSKADFPNLHKSYDWVSFSPDGLTMVYQSNSDSIFYSIMLKSGRVTSLIDDPAFVYKSDISLGAEAVNYADFSTWLEDGSMLANDLYDIWRIFPDKKRPAVNLTTSGSSGLKFRLIKETIDGEYLKLSDIFLIAAFNMRSKENGLYRCKLSANGLFKTGGVGPYVIYKTNDQAGTQSGHTLIEPFVPQRSAASDTWIYLRQSTRQAPNIFLSVDFNKQVQCSNFCPEKAVNWINSFVVNYTTPFGRAGQAVVYTPENIDSTKKYPTIFNYYEKITHRAYEYPYPSLVEDNINIPWLVSNGYIVCTPDIMSGVSVKTDTVRGEYALDY